MTRRNDAVNYDDELVLDRLRNPGDVAFKDGKEAHACLREIGQTALVVRSSSELAVSGTKEATRDLAALRLRRRIREKLASGSAGGHE